MTRVFLLAALSLQTVSSLMFQSHEVKSQWDTWAFNENGTYYVYYLVTEHSPGEGFGVATSPDGQHWTDHGYVFHGPSWTEHKWWEGTGSVYRAPDFKRTGRYLINWSQDPGRYQNITFGESYDLIHWTPLNNSWFNIDEQYYNNPGRWDCIYTLPDPSVRTPATGSFDGYPRYGFWTASPKSGTMGFGITHDGVTWQALPSPQMVPGIGAEVGAVEYIQYGPGLTKGGYYAILGTGGHMITYNASNISGPYYAAKKNQEVLPSGHPSSAYFARFFYSSAMELIVTHQTYSHQGRTYVAPFKKAMVDDDGTLRFGWWKQNENLKGDKLPALDSHGATLSNVDVSQGVIIEATFKLPQPQQGTSDMSLLPGFVMETADMGAIVAVVTDQCHVVLASVSNATAPANATLIQWGDWNREVDGVEPGMEVNVRVLYRRDMMEMYVNDYLYPVHLLHTTTTGRIGILPAASGSVSSVNLYAMSLPGNETHINNPVVV